MKSEIVVEDRGLRVAEVRGSSVSVADRTVEIVWSTGAPVRRRSWSDGDYIETLSMDPAAIDLSRLNSGASFLNAHAQGSMADRLGSVVPGTARVENGQGICLVKLSTARAGQQVLDDLQAGLSLPVSVGYRVSEYLKTEAEGDNELPQYEAIRWEPMEVSAVPIPADPGAHARSEPLGAGRASVPVTHRRAEGAAELENHTMTTPNTDAGGTLERTRAEEIMSISENHNIPLRLARKAVNEGKTVTEFREMALDHKRKELEKHSIFSISPYDRGDDGLPLADALADAISARIDRSFKPADGARGYVGLSAAEMARRALEARGTGTAGMSPNKLVERALTTTSDFPTALLLAGERQLAKGYTAAPSGLKVIAKATTSRDFRPKATIILAGGGQLLKVNEHGEYKRATFVEGVESYALSSFGRIFGITRQALVNDDLGVFADLPARFGRAATEFEASYLAAMLEQNPKMGDGKAVFHADHANLAASGSAPSMAALSDGRLAMRQQVDASGDLVSIVPKYLIVPAALETIAEQLLGSIVPTTSAEANPFAGKLELIIEPRLKSATAWYLAADPVQFPGVEYAHLEGQEGPRLDQRVGFDIDGTEFKVALDFGAAVTDHRGLYKNLGL